MVQVYIIFGIAALIFAVIIRLQHGSMDGDRIRSYIERQGGKLLDAHWTPFGPGSLDDQRNRIYEVRYLDNDGNQHHAFCKTSGWIGVSFTEDEIEECADASEKETSLEEENRRLREELERLKGRQGGFPI